MLQATKRDATDLLIAWRGGDEDALVELIPIVYGRLKRMAARFLRQERPGHTLQPTALVHEAYLRLIELKQVSWQDRAHFLSVCARLMHRVLVEHARHHGRAKRGSGARKVPLETLGDLPFRPLPDLVALNEAIRDLAARDRVLADIVVLRYFGGLNRDQIGEVLGISGRTVTRRGRMARAWLRRCLAADREQGMREPAGAG